MKKSFGMNVGSTSIILIFIVLSLVSFAALSLSSAVVDKNLTQRSADRVTAYYSASNKAQEHLADIYANLNSKEEYDAYVKENGKDLIFDIPISDNQSLHVEAVISYDNKPVIDVKEYREILIESAIQIDDSLPVFGK